MKMLQNMTLTENYVHKTASVPADNEHVVPVMTVNYSLQQPGVESLD